MLKETDEAKDHLSEAEVKAQINALSAPDLFRLQKIARTYSGGGVEEDDLIQIAIEKALSGARKCPRHIDFMKFIANAMKSIAHAERKKKIPENEIAYSRDQGEKEAYAFDCDSKAQTQSYEQAKISEGEQQELEKRLQEVINLFSADDNAMIILMGRADGMSAQQIREEFDMSRKSYDTTCRRIRRILDKHYPKGWRQ